MSCIHKLQKSTANLRTQVMSNFVNVDQVVFEKAKLDKVLKRFLKKGTEDVKKLAQKIFNNVDAETKRKSGSKETNGDSPAPKPPNTISKSTISSVPKAEPVAGVKRPSTDNTAALAQKKPNLGPNAKAAATQQKLAAAISRRTGSGSDSKDSKDPKATAVAAVNALPKPKEKVVVAKPATSLFSGLTSASKKPGTSNAALAATKTEKPR